MTTTNDRTAAINRCFDDAIERIRSSTSGVDSALAIISMVEMAYDAGLKAATTPPRDGKVRTEDGQVITHASDAVYWRASPCGLGVVGVQAIQKPWIEHSCVFFSGVGLSPSVSVPVICGRAIGVFASRQALENAICEAAESARKETP